MKKVLTVLGAVFIGLFVIGFVGAIAEEFNGSNVPTQPTQQAVSNTQENAFVSGCTETGELSDAQCVCMLSRLTDMYPDFTTNLERLQRIMTTGYSSTETDVLVGCI